MVQMPRNLNNLNLALLKFDEIQFTDVNNLHVDVVREGLDGHKNICISLRSA